MDIWELKSRIDSIMLHDDLGIKFLEFIGKNLTIDEANELLKITHSEQDEMLFQDVGNIIDNNGLKFFHVINNGIAYQYQVELSRFDELASLSKPECLKRLEELQYCKN